MSDRNVKQMMDKLKDHYDEMPTKSSSSQIMSQIKKEKRPWWGSFFHKWQAAALIVLALGIGSVLTIGQLSNMGSSSSEEMSQESAANEDSVAALPTQEEVDEERNTFALSEDPESGEAKIATRDSETETTVDIITIEGMEEAIAVKDVLDEELGFSTKIDERYETATAASGEDHSFQVFANHTGEKEKVPFFFVTEHFSANDSVEELELLLKEQYEASESGYTERPSENWFVQQETDLNFVSELSFEAPGSFIRVGIVEHDGMYYSLTVHFFGEAQERAHADMDLILRHARFSWNE